METVDKSEGKAKLRKMEKKELRKSWVTWRENGIQFNNYQFSVVGRLYRFLIAVCLTFIIPIYRFICLPHYLAS